MGDSGARRGRRLCLFDDENGEPLRIVALVRQDVDHAEVRLSRPGVDHAPDGPVRPAELPGAEGRRRPSSQAGSAARDELTYRPASNDGSHVILRAGPRSCPVGAPDAGFPRPAAALGEGPRRGLATHMGLPPFKRAMPGYIYELRRGDTVIATGHLNREEPFQVGERVKIGGKQGIVRSVNPLLVQGELRMVVQLARQNP